MARVTFVLFVFFTDNCCFSFNFLVFKTRVHIRDNSLFKKIKIINFLKKKAKFTKLQAGAYFMGVGAKVKRLRNI